MKIRSSDTMAKGLEALGASTVWCLGSEMYTMLASGAVNVVTYLSSTDMYDVEV